MSLFKNRPKCLKIAQNVAQPLFVKLMPNLDCGKIAKKCGPLLLFKKTCPE
jgi:hypothetical protein